MAAPAASFMPHYEDEPKELENERKTQAPQPVVSPHHVGPPMDLWAMNGGFYADQSSK